MSQPSFHVHLLILNLTDVTDMSETFNFFCHSFDYENAGYQAADLIKMDILLNGRPVEELATIVHK